MSDPSSHDITTSSPVAERVAHQLAWISTESLLAEIERRVLGLVVDIPAKRRELAAQQLTIGANGIRRTLDMIRQGGIR